MNLIDFTTNWAKGDIIQGKVMLGVGLLCLFAAVAIFKSEHAILRGALIPLALMVLILVGYGGFLAFTRSSHLEQVTTSYAKDPKSAVEKELAKATKDHKAYTTFKPIWVVLIIVAAVLYLSFSSLYLKGLCIGLIGLFLTVLMIDTTQDYRLGFYLDGLKQMMN